MVRLLGQALQAYPLVPSPLMGEGLGEGESQFPHCILILGYGISSGRMDAVDRFPLPLFPSRQGREDWVQTR